MSKKGLPPIKFLRAAMYIRESSEEQDKGFSPANQERTIREYAKKKNIQIVGSYKDLISGRSAAKRPDFQRMMQDAQAKKFDLILVYHTSRFARNTKESRQYKDHLRDKLSINVISVTQDFGDTTAPTGFLIETMTEVQDEMLSRNISFWVRSSLHEKRRQGKQLGNPPLGYYKKKIGFDSEKNRSIYQRKWLVHKKEAALVKRIFQDYSTGNYSYTDLAERLNKQRNTTKNGNPFTSSSIKDTLGNKVYIGYVYSPRRNYPDVLGEHPKIITEALYDKVQLVIKERTFSRGRPVAPHRFYLLKDLLFCHRCLKTNESKKHPSKNSLIPKMYSETLVTKKGKEFHFYKCKLRRECRSCNQPHVKTDLIDDQMLKFMEAFRISNDTKLSILSKLEQKLSEANISKPDSQRDVDRLKRQKKKLEYRYMEMEDMSDEQYKQEVEAIKLKISKLESGTKPGGRLTADKILKKTEAYLEDFPAFWNTLTKTDQRSWIVMLIKRIWVDGKKIVAIEPYEEYMDFFKEYRKVMGQPPLATPKRISQKSRPPIQGAGFYCLQNSGILVAIIYYAPQT